jgi:Xaa-Pro dipeptidase
MASVHSIERDERIRRLAVRLAASDLSAGILWDPATLCYFTANQISGPSVAVIGRDESCVVFCDEYDAYNFESLGGGLEIKPCPYWDDPIAVAADWVRHELGGSRLGLETADLRHTMFSTLSRILSDVVLTSVDDIIADIQLVKSPAEIDVIRRSARLVEQGYIAADEALATATTERVVAAEIFSTLLRNGSDDLAGQPYVKSGDRALNTHARWTDRTIAPGDHVFIELAACVQRYQAALMRTRLPGSLSPAVQRAVDAVKAGRDAHLAKLRPGVTGHDLHAAYLDALERRGVASWNRHSSGEPLGIAYPPNWGETRLMTLTRGVERPIMPGMVLHVISGLTEPDEQVPHVGLSECVLITEDGYERLVEVRDFL